MAFKLGDFKKTSRGTAEGRVIYPHQIRDGRYTASIGYAIAYFEQMVGRRRAEFEADALLEFFGDPRLARGLVACLAETYSWRMPDFAEALGEPAAQALRQNGIERPADLRSRLYLFANERYGGYIPPEQRRTALSALCEQVSPAQIERVLTLDSEPEQQLTKRGVTPDPDQIVARYNYHSIETAIRQAELITLRMDGSVWTLLCSAHNLAQRYRIGYEVGEHPHSLFDERLDLTLYGQRDAMGGWARAGRRLSRVVLRLLATHPGSIHEGRAIVHLGGQRALLRLDATTLQLLGAGKPADIDDGAVWEDTLLDDLRRHWSRAFLAGQTAGWRLRRDPDPMTGGGTLVVPDFSLHRGRQSLSLCIATGRSMAQSLNSRLARLGRDAPVVVLAQQHAAAALNRVATPIVPYAEHPTEALPLLIETIERIAPRQIRPAPTPRQTIEQQIATDGFMDEATAADILGCAPTEMPALIRRWGSTELHALPGLGICDQTTLDEIRRMLDRAA